MNDGTVFEFESYDEWQKRWRAWFGTNARLFDADGDECCDTLAMKRASYPVILKYVAEESEKR